MNRVQTKTPISSITGLIIIIFFCIALIISIINYPPGFTPLKNWLSDLGNPDRNPAGAAYFNAGCIITGLFLIVFYYGLSYWQKTVSHRKMLLIAAQAFGIFSGIALMGVGVFNETYDPHHFIVSVLFFASSCIAILLVTLALRGSPGCSRTTAFAGYLAVTIGVIFAVQRPTIPSIIIIEWLSVFSMLLWAALLGMDMYRESRNQHVVAKAPANKP